MKKKQKLKISWHCPFKRSLPESILFLVAVSSLLASVSSPSLPIYAERISRKHEQRHYRLRSPRCKLFFIFFLGGGLFFVLYSALLHLPPLRFHCADGCWDRTQDRCNWCNWSDALTTRLDLIRCKFGPLSKYFIKTCWIIFIFSQRQVPFYSCLEWFSFVSTSNMYFLWKKSKPLCSLLSFVALLHVFERK
jgi:hypothetical protein